MCSLILESLHVTWRVEAGVQVVPGDRDEVHVVEDEAVALGTRVGHVASADVEQLGAVEVRAGELPHHHHRVVELLPLQEPVPGGHNM